jgi:predicted amidohydrolase
VCCNKTCTPMIQSVHRAAPTAVGHEVGERLGGGDQVQQCFSLVVLGEGG